MAINDGNSISGTIGNIVHYKRKKKNVMRIKSANVKNPDTPGQRNHRGKIKLSSRFIKSIHSFIKIGYQATNHDSPSNEARQFIIKNCFTNGFDMPVLNYNTIPISRGTIAAPEDCTLTLNGNLAHITWKKPEKVNNVIKNDKVMIAMFIDEGKEGVSQMLSNVAYRTDGEADLQIPVHTTPVHIWMFFYNPDFTAGEDKGKVSDSVYVGVIE